MKAPYFLLVSAALTACIFIACSNTKKSTSSDAAAGTSPEIVGSGITGQRWKLIELAGKPVADSINGKQAFIFFKEEDSSYAASGGCNGLGGKFELNERMLRIKFKQGMSTMMACPDMTVEEGLKKVLNNADNYTVNDNVLSLNKARMAPLARFRATE